MSPDAPDIVFVICHDLGRHLSVYGQSNAPVPGLERLAREGVVCDRFFSTSTMCSPSRASIMTGRHPHEVGVFGLTNAGWWDLDPGTRCLPHLLGEGGYQTVLVGMQHEASRWQRLGYTTRIEQPGPHPQNEMQAVGQALAHLRALPPRADRAPVFLNLGLFQPHRHDFYESYGKTDPAALHLPSFLPEAPGIREDLAHLEALIQAMDRAVAALMTGLDDAGLADNTLLIFTTDHGLPLPRAKCTVYDPGIGVAALLRWPGRIPAGGRCRALCSHIDWLPTLLDAAGLPVPEGLAGRSLLPAVNGQGPGHEAIFAGATYHGRYNPVRCLRTATHKLIRNYHPDPHRHTPIEANPDNGIRAIEAYPASTWAPPPQVELYDLVHDPDERWNLADDSALFALRSDLTARLQAWAQATQDPIHRIYATFGGGSPDGPLPPRYGV